MCLILALAFFYADETPKWDVNKPDLPLHAIEIDTQEGTWLNLDVSPDGKSIVFDLLGDLFLLPIEGGEAKVLTQGLAWDMQPRFSPDGKKIAFTSDRDGGDNIWIMNVDGSEPKAVTAETFRLLNNAVFSPDGSMIAARKHFTAARSLGAGEIWFYHLDGGDGVQIVKKPNDQKDLGEPAFSPDGRYLYYSQDTTPGGTFEYNKDPSPGIYTIFRRDLIKGETEAFLSGPGGAIRPTPSPDGSKLAYVRRAHYKTALFVYDIKSGENRMLTDSLDRDLQETWAIHGVYANFAWHPNGQSIFYWAGGHIQRIGLADTKIETVPFHVKTTHEIADAVRFPVEVAPQQFKVKAMPWLVHSPQNDQVAFVALGQLWIQNGNQKPQAVTQLKQGFAAYPSYARDGKSLVFVLWQDSVGGSLWTMDTKTFKTTQRNRQAGVFLEPVLSPDNRYLVYRVSQLGGLFPAVGVQKDGIYVLDLNQNSTRLVLEDGIAPQFGAESDRFFFTTFGEKMSQKLESIHVAGRDRQTHATGEMVMEVSVSPQNRWLAFVENFQTYCVPFVKGTELTLSSKEKDLPVRHLSKESGMGLHWSNNGDFLYWSLASQLARIATDPSQKDAEPTVQNFRFDAEMDAPKSSLLLQGARIITMVADEVMESGDIWVQNNRIQAIGPSGSLDVPKETVVVDVKGKTIIPGLIDVHAHGPYGSSGLIPQQNWHALATLAFGVTTVHDPSNDTATVFAASELAKAGRIQSSRIFSTGTILYGATMPGYTAMINSEEDAEKHLARQKAWGAFSVKSYNQPRRNQRQQVLAAARKLEMMVVPEGGSLFMHNMSMVADGHTGIEHAIPLANLYGDVAQFWGQSHTQYTPTLVVAYGGIWGENYWYAQDPVYADPLLTQFVPSYVLDASARRPFKAPLEEYNHIAVARSAKKMLDAGVKVQLGAHGQREGLAAHWEMWMMHQGGMTPLESLRCGTLNGALYLGLDKDLGSLENGKLADLVVLNSNPLDDLKNSRDIAFVMLNGRLLDGGLNPIQPQGSKRSPLFFQQPQNAWPAHVGETHLEGGCHGACQHGQ
ncbi:MAG: PD40 domain-containing protein [Acidobacteria bacterium]|nr:PD40 domain-containing protein [Acidobacteriota bacterium]MCB9398805.1 PD40 domain-containing protein [Acidobacteriota bacterium]